MENKQSQLLLGDGDESYRLEMSSGDPTGSNNVSPSYRPLPLASSPSSQLTMDMKNSVLHGSMEDIHHPRNYRCGRMTTPALQKSPPVTAALTASISSTSPSYGSCGGALMNIACSSAVRAGGNVENGSLYKHLGEEKRARLLRKAAMIFLYGALKKSSERLTRSEEQHHLKSVECAARLILHNLLLNSWRKDRNRLTKLDLENAQLTISVRSPVHCF